MRGITISFNFVIVAIAGAFLIFLSDLVPYSGPDAYFRQPRFFPSLSLIALVCVGLSLIARYATGAKLPIDEELSGSRPHFRVLAPIALIFTFYILAVPWIGYLASTLIFGCAVLWAGRHLTKVTAGALIILGLILYLVFVAYLDVWFPRSDFSIESLLQ